MKDVKRFASLLVIKSAKDFLKKLSQSSRVVNFQHESSQVLLSKLELVQSSYEGLDTRESNRNTGEAQNIDEVLRLDLKKSQFHPQHLSLYLTEGGKYYLEGLEDIIFAEITSKLSKNISARKKNRFRYFSCHFAIFIKKLFRPTRGLNNIFEVLKSVVIFFYFFGNKAFVIFWLRATEIKFIPKNRFSKIFE